ncbi:hypothetical protein FVE85_4326 [Porphyridium purpureum]|uniref:Uncharacterized protein n=1 Tax=Porphyridium purpureum TaxID=35688 RepID=A0A5J4YS72_PORPP|nr:hypothetical protein FVE85_4326 [Porphyridium purpureum]|eukprot:POR2341..scf229_5
MFGSTSPDLDDIQAEVFVRRGGILLGSFVDVRVGDESEVEAVKVVKMRRPDNELEFEQRWNAALELCLDKLRQSLDTTSRDAFFSMATRAQKSKFGFSAPPFSSQGYFKKTVATPASPFDTRVSIVMPLPKTHGSDSPQDGNGPD